MTQNKVKNTITGNIFDLVFAFDVVKYVLLLVEDGIVCLQVVLAQKFRLYNSGEIEQGIAHSQNKVLGHFV